jgi:hypothetical protein
MVIEKGEPLTLDEELTLHAPGSRWGFFMRCYEHPGLPASDYFNLIGQLL